MTPVPAEYDIDQWVASSDGQSVIHRASGSILQDVREKRLSLLFLNLERSAVENPETMLAEIQSALTLFLLEKNSTHLQGLTHDPNAAIKLRHWFVRFWIDQTRRPYQDRYRYLYKRITNILRDSDRFYTHAPDQKGTFFSMAPENQTTAPLCYEDLEGIDMPGEMARFADFDSINHKKTILAISGHFWQQVSELFGEKAVWVEIKALMAWIGRTVSFENMLETAQSLEDNPAGAPPCNRMGYKEYSTYDPEMVKVWAQKAARILSEKERLVFYLRYGRDMGLQAIAEYMGSHGRSAGRSSYWLDKAHHRLKTFLRDLPWLSPEDLSEEAFSLFRETLLDHLKEMVLMP